MYSGADARFAAIRRYQTWFSLRMSVGDAIVRRPWKNLNAVDFELTVIQDDAVAFIDSRFIAFDQKT